MGVYVCVCSRDEKKAFHFEGALTLRLIGRISGIQEDSFDNFLKHTPLTRSHEQGSHSLLCARYCSSNVLLLLYHRTFGSANLCSCCTQNDRGLVSIQNLCVAFTCGCPKALPRTASHTHTSTTWSILSPPTSHHYTQTPPLKLERKLPLSSFSLIFLQTLTRFASVLVSGKLPPPQ